MDLSEQQHDRVLAAVAPALALHGGSGGVASVLLEEGATLLDAAVELGERPRVWRRPLPTEDAHTLDTLLGLLARRRGQLAHDLSGPATGVLAALETVLVYEPIPESSRALLSEARDGVIRFSQLLSDPLSVLEAADGNMVEAPLDQLLAAWATSLGRTLDPSGERLAVEVEPHPELAPVDARTLAGALAVFLANAWRARRNNRAALRLRAEIRDGWVWVHLEDDGAGMPADVLRRAGDLGYSRHGNGAGLGLFLARWALRRGGGGLLLETTEPGVRASVFTPLNTRTG